MDSSWGAPRPELMVELIAGTAATIVSFEFLGSSDGPGPAEFLAGRSTGVRVYRADPIVVADRLATSRFEDLATMYADAIMTRVFDLGSLTIVGHCTAARFAELVAVELEKAAGIAVTVVLVCPFIPDQASVGKEFTELCQNLDPAGAPLWTPSDEFRLDHALTVLRLAAANSVAGSGIGADEAATVVYLIVSRYQTWLTFLDGLARGGAVTRSGATVEIRSSDMPVPGPVAEYDRRSYVVMEAERVELPRSPVVTDHILGLALA